MKMVTIKFTKPWSNYAKGNVASFKKEEVEPLINGYTYTKNERKYKVAPVARKVGEFDLAKSNKERRERANLERISKLEAKRDKIQAKIDRLTGEQEKLTGPKQPETGNNGGGDDATEFKLNSKTTKEAIMEEMRRRNMEVDEEKLRDDLAAELQAELDKE